MLATLNQIPLIQLPEDRQTLGIVIKSMDEIEVQRTEAGIATEPPHRHQFYTIIWHREGRGQHMVDFEYYSLAPNQVYLLAPGMVHQMISTTKPRGWVILFMRDFWEQYGPGFAALQRLQLFQSCYSQPPISVPPAAADLLDHFCQQLMNEFQQQQAGFAPAMASWLHLFMTQLHRLMLQQSPGPAAGNQPESTSHKQRLLVQQFLDRVESNHRKAHQVQHYADVLNMTPGYLNELIKSYTGRTAKEVITDRLLLEAKREALFSDKTSKEVAFELGFDDPAHFSKFFKSGTGNTFMAYRDLLLHMENKEV